MYDEPKYKVCWNDKIIARDMNLLDAIVLIKAYCQEYPSDMKDGSSVSVMRSEAPECAPQDETV